MLKILKFEEKYENIYYGVHDVEVEKEESHPMTDIPNSVQVDHCKPNIVLDGCHYPLTNLSVY